MGRLHFSWAMGVVAPWCLGVGMVISIAADAGQDAVIGASVAPPAVLAVLQPSDLIPIDVHGPGFGLDPARSTESGGVREARLVLGDKIEFQLMPDEIAPRVVLKRHAHGFPVIDRSNKGDPAVGLRPAFDSALERKGGLAALRAHQMIFADAEVPQAGFSAQAVPPPSFTPRVDGASSATPPAGAAVIPPQAELPAAKPADASVREAQGMTPPVPRAETLSAMTPATDDATPVEIVALSSIPGEMSSITPDRPDYAALIDDQSHRELRCLAEAVYFEARGESEKGQAAVAQVVLNRATSGLYPSSICGVVFQNRQHYHACQFSFACEGRSLRIEEPGAWRRALRIARNVTNGQTYVAAVGDATHYHANYVHPYWARRLERTDRIGHHIFYKLRPGQT